MADEPDNETPETAPDATEQAPAAEAVGESAEVDATAEAAGDEPAEAEATAATAGEEPAEAEATAEPDAAGSEQAPAADAEDTATPAAPAPPAEPVERISPKERRRRARLTHTGESRPARSPEERHAERLAERRTKAVRRRARRLQERAKAATRRAAVPAGERSELGQLAPVHPQVEGTRMVRQGVVVSDKAEKTITVRIDVARRHRRYEKIVRSSSTVHAHDENNDAHEGDVVRVIESRPLSRTKRWALVDVLERAR
jgi:small subunit ribosomal protein S17